MMWPFKRSCPWSFHNVWPFRAARAWDDAVYWALDLETTGLSVKDDHVISVGMVPIREGTIRWGERFYSLVRPPSFRGLTEETMAVHHILPDELAAAPLPDEILPEVVRRLAQENAALLVHHAPLDVAILKRCYREHGVDWPRVKVVDTIRLLLRLDHRRHQLDPYGKPLPKALSEARSHLGLPPYDYHHALTDALATAELFLLLRARLGLRRLRQVG